MLYLVPICLLLGRTTFCSAGEQPNQSGNQQQLGSLRREEISPGFNEISSENKDGPYETISYKPVTLEEQSNITSKQAYCLKIGNEVKSISRASLWVPLSNSKHLDNLKVVCNQQQKPKMWFGQSKYQEYDYNQKIQSVKYEGDDTIVIILEKIRGTLSFELPACNVCLKQNEADSNYVSVYIAPKNNGKKNRVKRQATEISVFDTLEQPERANGRFKRASSQIKVSASRSTKDEGDSYTTTCSADTNNITWTDPKGKEVKSSVNSDPRVKESFARSHNNSELIFRNISRAMEGRYTCTRNNSGAISRETFDLSVIVPVVKPKAKITPSKKSVTLDEGSDYTVECSGNSNNVTWGHALNYFIPTYQAGFSSYYMLPAPSLNKSTLYFKNVTTYFGGEYICRVNISGLQDTERLVIAVKKASLKFSPENNGVVSVKENKDYEITCEGTLRSIAWYYNGGEVSTDKRNEVYQKNPELKEDGIMARKLKFDDVANGTYLCSGILSFNGSRIDRSFQLKVQEDKTLNSPKLTINDEKISGNNIYRKVNESLEVVCHADTNNTDWKGPPFSWKIPENSPQSDPVRSERIKKKKLALKLKSIVVESEGDYTCEVTRGTLTKSKSFKLNVIDPVRIIGFPQSPTSREGGFVTLACMTTGHPKPMVNWYYNEKRSDGSSHPKLIDGQTNPRYKFEVDSLLINNITYKEAGRYMCEAKQDIEKGTTDMRVIDVAVEHKPYPTKNHTIYEKTLSTGIEVPCKMIANPAPWYTWYKKIGNNYELFLLPSPDSVLKLNVSNESLFGEYKCSANNYIGYDEQYISLIPMQFPNPPTVELAKVTKTFAYFKAIAERNSSFTYYNIEYKEKNTREWVGVNVTLGETWDYKYELTNLMEKTTYILRARSINDLGISKPSNEIEFTTDFGIRLTVSTTLLLTVLILKWIF